jgi:exodeoxyribonuclease VII large subunit
LEIDPSFTLGELQKERELTLQRLEKEGWLNLNQQLSFPFLPKRIAVISADNSKGYADFMEVLQRNPAGYRFMTFLFPAYLQGDVAVQSINEQLEQIRKVKHYFDVVVIVRGGGGEVGLSCYNHFDLCASIATFPIPILTGIGHSTNITVAEMVAFRNAITPTELADFLIQAFDEIRFPLNDASKVIKQAARNIFMNERDKLQATGRLLSKSARINIQYLGEKMRREILLTKLEVKAKLFSEKEQVQHLSAYLKQNSQRSLHTNHQQIKENISQLLPSVNRYFQGHRRELEHMSLRVGILDPVNVLKRGYSIVRVDGMILNEERSGEVGETMEVESYHWKWKAKIINIDENER